MATIDSMFELAIELRDRGELRDSIKIFNKILEEFPTDKKSYGIYTVVGGVHADLGENVNAYTNFKKATELNPKSELASLGLYVTLAEQDRNEEAIIELKRFLCNYPANLYKDTLKELLVGLEKGYMVDYENDIRYFARVNGVINK